NNRSRLKPSFISTIASHRGCPSCTATASQPCTSRLTRKPAASRKHFTAGQSEVSCLLARCKPPPRRCNGNSMCVVCTGCLMIRQEIVESIEGGEFHHLGTALRAAPAKYIGLEPVVSRQTPLASIA